MKHTVKVTTQSGAEMEITLTFWQGKRVYNNFDRNYYDIATGRYPKNGNTIIHRQLTEEIKRILGE